MSPVFLIGMPGAGKSTLGRQLAKALKCAFFDLDHIIEEREQRAIPDIFEIEGERYFRNVERNTLRDLIEQQKEMVLACGGGTPCFHENMDVMNASGVTVYLKVPIETLLQRVANAGKRPLLKHDDPKQVLERLLAQRRQYYESAQVVLTENSREALLTALPHG